MADYTLAAGDVEYALANVGRIVSGATITAGQLIYRDASASNVAKLAQCDGTAAEAAVIGMAVCNAVAGQPLLYVAGPIDIVVGGAMTEGAAFALSAAAGKFADEADITTAQFLTRIGYAVDATTLHLEIQVTGINGTATP